MGRLALAGKTLWNRQTYRALRNLIHEVDADLVHVHNFLPLLSPSIFYAASAEGIPAVQTLHNYRLLCPQAQFFRNGQVCEACLGKPIPWPGVQHGCYRHSKAASSGVAAMLSLHRALNTWENNVSTYITLTEFARQKYIEGGLPAAKLVVKPNFVDVDPGLGNGEGGFALFVGRLSPEKGIETMLEAWSGLDVPLVVVGDGPLGPEVEQAAKANHKIKWMGRRPREEVLAYMKSASMLIFPSLWYEGLPMTIVEAFAVGLPVIASDMGSMSTLVAHRQTGLHFQPGNVEDLRHQIRWLGAHSDIQAAMRDAARAEFEKKYSAEQNIRLLLDIYQKARFDLERKVHA
jgi:glycosyltransferase involved in cell wall biosynthesis